MNYRYLLNERRSIILRDKSTIDEMLNFTRQKDGSWGDSNSVDDRVTSLIWALMVLEPDVCSRYYEIVEMDINQKPLVIKPQYKGQFVNTGEWQAQQTEEDYLPMVIGSGNSSSNMGEEDLNNSGWRRV